VAVMTSCHHRGREALRSCYAWEHALVLSAERRQQQQQELPVALAAIQACRCAVQHLLVVVLGRAVATSQRECRAFPAR
jgi:hypothetical protein